MSSICQKSNTNISKKRRKEIKRKREIERGITAKTNSIRCVHTVNVANIFGWYRCKNHNNKCNKFDICFCLHLRRSAATMCCRSALHSQHYRLLQPTTNAVIVANVSHFHEKHHAIKSRDIYINLGRELWKSTSKRDRSTNDAILGVDFGIFL